MRADVRDLLAQRVNEIEAVHLHEGPARSRVGGGLDPHAAAREESHRPHREHHARQVGARSGVQSHYHSRGVPAGLAPAAEFDAAWARRSARKPSINPFDPWRLARPRHNIEAMGSVAARHGARLHFLYLPVYGKPWAEVAHRELSEACGDVWNPPEEIFRDRAC